MSAIDYRLISTDDHVIEPRDLFEGRLPGRFRDRAPRVIEEDDADVWLVEGRKIPQSGLSVMAGRAYEEYSPKAVRFADMRPGCYDPEERLRDMDLDGVEAQVLFPSLPGLGGQVFSELEDRDFALACLRAYNEWMADSWCSVDPRRLIGQVIVPLWNVRLALQEVQHGVALGHKALSFSATPESLGFPGIGDPHSDPLWDAVEEAGVAPCTSPPGASTRARCRSRRARALPPRCSSPWRRPRTSRCWRTWSSAGCSSATRGCASCRWRAASAGWGTFL
jgi:hypothetical protein